MPEFNVRLQVEQSVSVNPSPHFTPHTMPQRSFPAKQTTRDARTDLKRGRRYLVSSTSLWSRKTWHLCVSSLRALIHHSPCYLKDIASRCGFSRSFLARSSPRLVSVAQHEGHKLSCGLPSTAGLHQHALLEALCFNLRLPAHAHSHP